MPSNVLIFRLVSNEIIAAQSNYNSKDKTYHLIWPVEIYFKRLVNGGSMIGLYPWLITEIIQINSSVLEESKVMTCSHPTEKFIEYYQAMIEYYEKNSSKEQAEKQLDSIIKSYKDDSFTEDYDDHLLDDEIEEIKPMKIKTKKDKKLH